MMTHTVPGSPRAPRAGAYATLAEKDRAGDLAPARDKLLDRVWARMSERGDFPMLSQALRTAIAAMHDEELDSTALTRIVLSDFALTQKVLRLANSAMYRAFGGNITTVSRALMVLGMDAVGHLVVGLKIVDHFHQSAPRRLDARLELNRTMLSGCVARKLTERGGPRTGEEAVVCTLMRQLGKLLVVFYLDAEWDQIRQQVEAGASEADACLQVLGLSFDDIGLEAAQRWQLPEGIRAGMMRYDPDEDAPRDVQWLRAITHYSTEVAETLTAPDLDATERERRIAGLAQRYSRTLATDAHQLVDISLGLASEEAGDGVMREIMELRADADAMAREALTPEARIEAGTEDLRALPSGNALATALALASETVLAGLSFARTLVFVREPDDYFRSHLGFGHGLEAGVPDLAFGGPFEPDVFHLAISNPVGIFIENARDPKMLARLPAWFRRTFADTSAFVLLPVVLEDRRTVALLYGDWTHEQQTRRISQPEMAALNTLAQELRRFFTEATADETQPL